MKIAIALPPAKTPPLPRAVFAKLQAAATNRAPEEIAKAMHRGDEVLRVINRDAPAPVATTADAGYAAELVQTDFGQFLGWLAPASAAARILAMGLHVPMRGGTFKAPARDTSPSELPWIGESAPMPVRSMTLMGVELSPRKMATMSIISREAAKYGGEAVITSLLREDAAKSVDAAYFSTAAGDTIVHPGLLSGATPIAGYAGGDEPAFLEDIAALLAVVAPNGSSDIVLVTGQHTALRIAVKFPDFPLQVFPSQAVPESRLIAVDAGALVHSIGDFEIDISRDAVVHMEADPDDVEHIADAGTMAGSSPVRSLFQTDAWGIRILGEVAFAGRKANVAAYVEGVTW